MRLFSFMFVTAVCVLFLMKIRWPKTKSIDLWFRHKLLLLLLLLLLTFHPPFPGSFFCRNGIFIARHLSPLFVTGFVKLKKKPLTMVINMIRIAFTQSSSYSELLSKWLSSRSCLKFRGGNDDSNFLRHLVCLSFGRGPCSKMYAMSHEKVLKIASLAISMEPTRLLEKVSSYSLLPRLWLLVRPSEPLLPKQIKERPHPPPSLLEAITW